MCISNILKRYLCCYNKMESYIDWSKIDENIEELTLENMKIQGKVVSVYDGDTIKVVFPYLNRLFKWNCRLPGVDTPELRTRNVNEKKYGYVVKEKLVEKILHKIVEVECGEFDKYGRLLTKIYIDNECVNQWLIDNDYAFAYDGGTKQSWEEYLVKKNDN